MHFRSQWTRDRKLGLRVRIPSVHCYLSLVSVVCCQVDIFATGRSLIQRRSTRMLCPNVIRERDGAGLVTLRM